MYNIYHNDIKKGETSLKTYTLKGIEKGKVHKFSVEIQGGNTEHVTLDIPPDGHDSVQKITSLRDGEVEVVFNDCPTTTHNRIDLGEGRIQNVYGKLAFLEGFQPETTYEGDFFCVKDDEVVHGPYRHQFTTMPFDPTITPEYVRFRFQLSGYVTLSMHAYDGFRGYYTDSKLELYKDGKLINTTPINSGSPSFTVSTAILGYDTHHQLQARYVCPKVNRVSDFHDFTFSISRVYPGIKSVSVDKKTYDGATLSWEIPQTTIGTKPKGYDLYIDGKLYKHFEENSIRVVGMPLESSDFDIAIYPKYEEDVTGERHIQKIEKFNYLDANLQVYTPAPNSFLFEFDHPLYYGDKLAVSLDGGTPKYISENVTSVEFGDLPWGKDFLVKAVVEMESGESFVVAEYFMKTPPQG